MENDAEVERLGSKETWNQTVKHWGALAGCGDPAELVMTGSKAEDW